MTKFSCFFFILQKFSHEAKLTLGLAFVGLATNLLTLKATKKAWLENGSCRKYHRLRAQLLFCVNLHFIFMQFGFRDS